MTEISETEKCTKYEIALEEWKLLQPIIARLEETEYKIRSWLFPLITALTVAFYSTEVLLTPNRFLMIGLGLILAFMVIELLHRPPKHFAIERAKEVEEVLRTGVGYTGPCIAKSMSQPRFQEGMAYNETKRMIFHGPYLPIIVFVWFCWWLAS